MASIRRPSAPPLAKSSQPGPVTPAAWNALVNYAVAMEARIAEMRVKDGPDIGVRPTPDGVVLYEKRKTGRRRRIDPPFSVYLETVSGETITYAVTVSEGFVCDLDRTAGAAIDAITLHPCDNRLTAGVPTKFTIGDGEAIFVKVLEDENGKVTSPVTLVVADDSTPSTNYIPTDPVQDGEYYYKLASLSVSESVATLSLHLSGSHIFRESGLTADVLIEDCSGDQYADPVVPGNQLVRMSFLSGRLILLNETETNRPLAANYVREQFAPCSESGPP